MTIREITLYLRVLLLIYLTLLLTSCIEFEVKQAININKDGSGDAKLEIAVQQEAPQEIISAIKAELKKELQGWITTEGKNKDGKQVIVFGRKFKDISELNHDEGSFSFSSERKGILKKAYVFESKQLKSSDIPFPYESSVKMPGSIDETNGTKVSSNEVKWNLQGGLRKGTTLFVKSSGFALPDFASLKESFNRTFDSVFYRKAIVFLRDRNLWVMDSDGKNQRQLTKEGVGSWSVSRDGKIIFDRFRRFDEDKRLTDLNIYYIASIKDGKIEKLTDDNKSMAPVISPDGTKIAFQKFRWGGETYIGSGEGMWIIDLVRDKQEELAGIISVPSEIKQKRNALLGRFGKGEMDEKKWLYDSPPIWSSENKTIAFARMYDPGGYVPYIMDIESRQPTVPFPEKIVRVADLYDNKILHPDCILTYTLTLYDTKVNKDYLLVKNACVQDGKFSPDGKEILFYTPPDSTGPQGLWLVGSDGSNKRKLTDMISTTRNGDLDMSWNMDTKRILFARSNPNSDMLDAWSINVDGSNLKKIADNAASPKWTALPRVSFVSPNVTKIIIFIAIALMGMLLLFGIALMARKAVKAIIPKGSVASKGIFCSHCGKENSRSASFCASCGQKMKIAEDEDSESNIEK